MPNAIVKRAHTPTAALECSEVQGWSCVRGHCEGNLGPAHRRRDASDVSGCALQCAGFAAFTLRLPAGCFCWHVCAALQPASENWNGRAVSYIRVSAREPSKVRETRSVPDARVVPHATAQQASKWLQVAVDGYCAQRHVSAVDRMKSSRTTSCADGASGRLHIRSARHWATWDSAVAQCLSLCHRCQSCAYISVSLAFRDCSWFDMCPLEHPLPAIFPGYRSGIALPNITSVTTRKNMAKQLRSKHVRTQQWSRVVD